MPPSVLQLNVMCTIFRLFMDYNSNFKWFSVTAPLLSGV